MPRKKASAGGCWILKMPGNGIHAISFQCRLGISPVVQTGKIPPSQCQSLFDERIVLGEPSSNWIVRFRRFVVLGSIEHLLAALAGRQIFQAHFVRQENPGVVEPIGIEPMTSSLQS
jgi:hypothetical protein